MIFSLPFRQLKQPFRWLEEDFGCQSICFCGIFAAKTTVLAAETHDSGAEVAFSAKTLISVANGRACHRNEKTPKKIDRHHEKNQKESPKQFLSREFFPKAKFHEKIYEQKRIHKKIVDNFFLHKKNFTKRKKL